MTTPRKAKRVLKDISFEHDTAHIALVSKEQGGPANGADYTLIMKATNGFSEEFIAKAQKVQVTMELPEFLERFFNLYGTDAQVLARMMGYVQPEEDDDEWTEDWYEKRIQERLDSFTILKSMHDSKNITDVMTSLDETQYLKMLTDQESLEKAFKDIEKNSAVKAEEGSTKAVAKAKKLDDKTAKVDPSETVNKGTKYMDELLEVQKALADQTSALDAAKVELQKALEAVEVFKAEKREAILKGRKAEVLAAVKDEAKTEILFKGLSLIEDEAEFKAVVKTLADMTAAVETGELFKEKGVQVEDVAPAVQESAVAKVIKATLAKNK